MSDARPVLSALRSSHDVLTARVTALRSDELELDSYCSEWNVAQVLSHLGSQAEIFSLFLDAGFGGGEPPSQQDFGPIWDAWNTRPPAEQAAESVAANESFLERLEALDPTELAVFNLSMFDRELDAATLLRMRLAEHALHAWDVHVVFDDGATVAQDAVEQLIDGLSETVARTGKPAEKGFAVTVRTSEPSRELTLETGKVSLDKGVSPAADASLDLPGEALLRAVYGRLDPHHTPSSVHVSGVSLDELRRIFPGF